MNHNQAPNRIQTSQFIRRAVLQDILHWLFDRLGRIDRKGLIALAGVVFGAQIIVYGSVWLGVAEADSAPVRTFEIVTLWICLAAATKRLHDIGLGAAWIAAAIGATFGVSLATAATGFVLFGPAALETGSNGYWSIVGLTALPALLTTL